LTAQRKVERDAAVVRDRARGLTWATIAERHGLCERECLSMCRERATDAMLFRYSLREAGVAEPLVEIARLVVQLEADAARG
jgi:hypothetical protein